MPRTLKEDVLTDMIDLWADVDLEEDAYPFVRLENIAHHVGKNARRMVIRRRGNLSDPDLARVVSAGKQGGKVKVLEGSAVAAYDERTHDLTALTHLAKAHARRGTRMVLRCVGLLDRIHLERIVKSIPPGQITLVVIRVGAAASAQKSARATPAMKRHVPPKK